MFQEKLKSNHAHDNHRVMSGYRQRFNLKYLQDIFSLFL